MEAAEGRTAWDLLSTHPSHENRRARLQGWLPEAMIYFADQSRPLPSNLNEVETAVRSRAEQSAQAPEGVRPSYSPGFWYRVQLNDRPKPTTMTFTGATPCVIGECLVLESDVGNTGLFSSDWDLFEQRTSDGLPVRFNPPLRVYQWPLRVGSSWSYMATIETSQGAKIPTRVTGDCCFVRVSDGTRWQVHGL